MVYYSLFLADKCSEWYFSSVQPPNSQVAFSSSTDENNVLHRQATLTCDSGFAFFDTNSTDSSELSSLTYTCAEMGGQFENSHFTANPTYVPHCVRK